MSSSGLDCPIDFVPINENRARLVALFVVSLTVICFITNCWYVSAFLFVDFLLRSVYLNNYSLLAILSGMLIKLFKIKNKPVDRAPKRFAAFVGVLFTATITTLLLLSFTAAAKGFMIILIAFAVLESFFGFCAGCYVYTYLKRFGIIK